MVEEQHNEQVAQEQRRMFTEQGVDEDEKKDDDVES